MWLTMENIMEKDAQVINEIADIVGSGQSVGGVVSQTVGTMDEGDDELQVCMGDGWVEGELVNVDVVEVLDMDVRVK